MKAQTLRNAKKPKGFEIIYYKYIKIRHRYTNIRREPYDK